MHKRTFLTTLVLAAFAVIGFTSCNKSLVPQEVSGLADALKGAVSSLEGIAGADASEAVAKATEAKGDLDGVGSQLGAVQGLMDKLPAPAKAVVSSAIEKFAPQIEELISKISAIPGVSGAIKPTLDKITAGLTALKG